MTGPSPDHVWDGVDQLLASGQGILGGAGDLLNLHLAGFAVKRALGQPKLSLKGIGRTAGLDQHRVERLQLGLPLPAGVEDVGRELIILARRAARLAHALKLVAQTATVLRKAVHQSSAALFELLELAFERRGSARAGGA